MRQSVEDNKVGEKGTQASGTDNWAKKERNTLMERVEQTVMMKELGSEAMGYGMNERAKESE